jgi:hypothetical protein
MVRTKREHLCRAKLLSDLVAISAGVAHISEMHTNFSVFGERLAEACGARNMTERKLCSGIGLGGRRAINLSVSGPAALDLYRIC